MKVIEESRLKRTFWERIAVVNHLAGGGGDLELRRSSRGRTRKEVFNPSTKIALLGAKISDNWRSDCCSTCIKKLHFESRIGGRGDGADRAEVTQSGSTSGIVSFPF
jgi:hypothetical protein